MTDKTMKTYTLINDQTGESIETIDEGQFDLWLAAQDLLKALIIGQRACQALANEFNDQDQTKLSASWQKHADKLNALIAKAKGE